MTVMKDVKGIHESIKRAPDHYTDGLSRSWRMRDFDMALSGAFWAVLVTMAIVWVVG